MLFRNDPETLYSVTVFDRRHNCCGPVIGSFKIPLSVVMMCGVPDVGFVNNSLKLLYARYTLYLTGEKRHGYKDFPSYLRGHNWRQSCLMAYKDLYKDSKSALIVVVGEHDYPPEVL